FLRRETRGDYRIVATMPDRDGQHMYRIKSPFEQYERAVKKTFLPNRMVICPNRFPRGCRAAAQSHRRFCNSRKRLGSNKSDHQFRFRPLNGFSLKIPTFKPRLCLAGFCLSKPERDLGGAPDPT